MRRTMEPDEFRQALAELNLSQHALGKWFKIGKRTSQGYALGERPVPGPTAILLRLMMAGKVSTKDIEAAHDR